ncbi:phosphoribosyltransferase family protein [Sulfurimonas sp.]
MICEEFSLTHICTICQKNFLQASLYKRKLPNGIEVISFYKYSEIKELLFTKHTELGFYIFTILAQLSFKKFADTFHTKESFVSIGIDDKPTNTYSHTAILNKALQTYNIKPLFAKLRAENSITYSGKSKAYRLANPRNFKLKHFKEKDGVILVDDIITTGTTLSEAIKKLNEMDKEVMFCLTLCDVDH